MKKIILMITLFIMTISTTLMAKSGAGVDITVPLGAGIGYFFQDGERIETLKPNAGFEGGVYLRPNYYFDLAVLSLGFSLDLGYQRDVFGYKSDRNIEYLSFDSLSIGLMPKIDVLFLSVGVGAGVKFPLGGASYSKENSGGEQSHTYNLKQLQDQFDNLYIPYLKVSLDFLLLYNFTLGIYVSYDFMAMQYKNVEPKVTFGALDIGGQVGIRF
ncbi:hypothetical protein [uncultured Brachyspira sp.]|uniref:hypothetical protein n=1 Tax=uncultured Brachyspira sp. TaxID=221953 RepID=UPI0025EAFFA0|nr:hypothetical protein [uncultured Brachyspira sp.]